MLAGMLMLNPTNMTGGSYLTTYYIYLVAVHAKTSRKDVFIHCRHFEKLSPCHRYVTSFCTICTLQYLHLSQYECNSCIYALQNIGARKCLVQKYAILEHIGHSPSLNTHLLFAIMWLLCCCFASYLNHFTA